MHTEIEAKWLNINIDEFREILKSAGAILVTPERLMTRRAYDFPDMKLESNSGWVRVRDEGDRITMSYKQLQDRTLHGTKESTVVVGNFNSACSFLECIGLENKSVQETKRESWKIGETEIEIDTWPWIKSFVEIESVDEAELRRIAELLGLDFSLALHGSVELAYTAEYDVTEDEIDHWKEILFTDVPEWLSAKRLS